MERLCIR